LDREGLPCNPFDHRGARPTCTNNAFFTTGKPVARVPSVNGNPNVSAWPEADSLISPANFRFSG
jgi:hypothetical protein